MTELTRTINNINELSTAQSDITSLQESVNNNTTSILTLESYIVLDGTNFGIGPDVLNQLTTGTQNTAVGNLAAGGEYRVSTGSGNVMVGYNSGGSCESGSNNTFLGTNTQFQPGISSISGSIGLGSNAVITKDNQFIVASNVTSFNISGLTASTGTGAGTILEFDSSGNIIPSAGTYNTVSSIDTEFSSLQSSVSSNTSNINTLLAGGTIFTTPGSGSYTVPSNVTTLVIEAMGAGGGGGVSTSNSGSDPWQGGGGGSSGVLQKITIPAMSGQVISFNIGTGGAGETPTSDGGSGGETTVLMYGQTILTCSGGVPGSGMDGGGLASSTAGISCGGGGGMGIYETSSYGTGGTGTFPGQNGQAYTPGETVQSGNGGLNNLGQAPISGNQSGSGGAGGGPTPGSYGCGGYGATSPGTTQLDGYAGGNGYVKISII